MRRRLPLILLLAVQFLALGLSISVWWAYRNNTVFGNGRWIIGKDAGKFVFYTYDFMFRPLEGSRIDLSFGMGFQEILFHRPEGPDRRMADLAFTTHVSRGGYLWIILRKQDRQWEGFRLSNHGGFPSGFYRYDAAGDLVAHQPLREIPISDTGWHRIRIHNEDATWRLSIDGALVAEVDQSLPPDGYFGFKGSGNTRAKVILRRIAMTFSDPANPSRTWSERERFKPHYKSPRLLAGGLLFSAVVVLLIGLRMHILTSMLPESLRSRFRLAASGGWALSFVLTAFFTGKEWGVIFPAAIGLGELIQFILLAAHLRGTSDSPGRLTVRTAAALYVVLTMVVGGLAFYHLGEALGRSAHITTKNLRGVNPGAYRVHPGRTVSSPPLELATPVRLVPGEPYFSEGRVYRDQRIDASFVMDTNVTLDIAFQLRSFLTRGDPEGEMLPLQRRLVRLSTRPDVAWGLSNQTGNRPDPFRQLQGELRPGVTNRIEIVSDSRGISIVLNGEPTTFPDLQPLGFGETAFMVYEPSVRLVGLRIESTPARAARDKTLPLAGFFAPFIWTALLWLVLRLGGRVPALHVLVMSSVVMFPMLFYWLAALMIGPGQLTFFEKERLAWQDLCLLAFALSHLLLLVVFRTGLRAKPVFFNLIFIGMMISAAFYIWDAVLPAGHHLKIKYGEAIAPADLAMDRRETRGPWYSDNATIGANTYIWRQQFGHESITHEKPDGVFRVFVLGGSQAWGSGAASSAETFAELIEVGLRDAGWPVEVFNAGVNGAGVGKVSHYYRDLLVQFSPDVIIVDIGLNDSAALNSVKGEARREAYTRRLADDFSALAAASRDHNTDVVLVLEPMCSETTLRPDRMYYDLLQEIAAGYGFEVADPGPVLRAAEPDYFVWWDTAHFAPRGHEIMAREIIPHVENVLRARSARAPGE